MTPVLFEVAGTHAGKGMDLRESGFMRMVRLDFKSLLLPMEQVCGNSGAVAFCTWVILRIPCITQDQQDQAKQK